MELHWNSIPHSLKHPNSICAKRHKSINNHYVKRGVLQLTLQLEFEIALTTSNSLYFYVVSVIK
jgi:hypothetical protein